MRFLDVCERTARISYWLVGVVGWVELIRTLRGWRG